MLRLERLADGQFSAPHVPGPGSDTGGVFGGQLLAQLVMAACTVLQERPLTSLHTVFCRAARADLPLLIDVRTVNEGRSAASLHLSLHQDGRVCAEATGLALTPQQLPLSHEPVGAVGPPADVVGVDMGLVGVESVLAAGADLGEPAGDAEVEVWVRAEGADAGDAPAKAMMAYASEPWLVAAALRPHEGWSATQAYSRFVPAVVSHSLWFHEHEGLGGWWAMRVTSPHLSRGRLFGRGDVFSGSGRLLASLTQENLMRPVA